MENDELKESEGSISAEDQDSLSELDTIPMDFVDQRLDDIEYVKKLLAGILLVSPEPLEINRISRSLGIRKALLEKASEELKTQYRSGGIIIQDISEGLALGTNPDIAEHLERFFQLEKRRRISRAALQTLSIIAYNQPVTRAEVEVFRGGINSQGIIDSLLERELIKIAGRKETPGTPFLYSVSDEFLKYFGLKSVEELKQKLPAIEDEIANDGGITQLKLRDLGIKSGADNNGSEEKPAADIENDLPAFEDDFPELEYEDPGIEEL